ncbi:MAG: twin-arginine translocation signal domain-containing protein [Planctomycetia bacterium]|nr:twin-arginine translocation signal domain-containing protein [Planctomycetia bacterium]
MKRRDFLKSSLIGAAVAGLAPTLAQRVAPQALAQENASSSRPRWFKGNLHSHSHWSDGQDLPEVVVDAYKRNGYDFFSLTDHNILHQQRLRFDGFAMNYAPSDMAPFKDENSFWKRIAPQYAWPNLVEEHLQVAKNRFGEDSVRMIETKDGKYVRMKTEEELRAQFAEPGKFLLIPGFEMTAPFIHVNLINVEQDFYMNDPSMKDLIVKLYDHACEFYADARRPYLFTVNHPLWQYYNIQPSYLFSRPGIRHFELLNNDTSYKIIPEAWTPELLWDIVNAYRACNDQPLLFATGTDDSHGIVRQDYVAFHSWMHVLADALEVESLFDAMNRGRSYVSTGLSFQEISFDGKTLAVKLDPTLEGQYRIEFYGVKKDYDQTVKYVETTDGTREIPTHTVECWSPEISKVLDATDRLEGSYTLKSDDLFVRAKAYRVGAGNVSHGATTAPTLLAADAAWTQPYRQGDVF